MEKIENKELNEIVSMYFENPEKTLEEIFGEYVEDLNQEDADRVLENLKEILN